MEPGSTLLLCVDDDPDVLTFLRAVLEAEGFTVLTAETAEEATRISEKQPPDAYLVDLIMEEVDSGLNLVKNLRSKGVEAPIFMLSSVGDSMSFTIETTELGISGVFQKPLQKAAFLSLLKAKLATRRNA